MLILRLLFMCVCLLTTLTVNSIVAICEPVKKFTRHIIGIMFGKKNDTIAIQSIGNTLLAAGASNLNL